MFPGTSGHIPRCLRSYPLAPLATFPGASGQSPCRLWSDSLVPFYATLPTFLFPYCQGRQARAASKSAPGGSRPSRGRWRYEEFDRPLRQTARRGAWPSSAEMSGTALASSLQQPSTPTHQRRGSGSLYQQHLPERRPAATALTTMAPPRVGEVEGEARRGRPAWRPLSGEMPRKGRDIP